MDWNEHLNVATQNALATASPAVGRPTSSSDWRLILQKVEHRRRVFLLQYIITLQNVLLWNKDNYVSSPSVLFLRHV
jgi:hypothetical protein